MFEKNVHIQNAYTLSRTYHVLRKSHTQYKYKTNRIGVKQNLATHVHGVTKY